MSPSSEGDTDQLDERPEDELWVTAHRSRPNRVVFTEQGNTDGWIASDVTVEPLR